MCYDTRESFSVMSMFCWATRVRTPLGPTYGMEKTLVQNEYHVYREIPAPTHD